MVKAFLKTESGLCFDGVQQGFIALSWKSVYYN